MKKYAIKRILIPVDFSEISNAATTNAITLAKLLQAEVFLIHVIENYWNQFSIILQEQILPPSRLIIEQAIEKKMEKIQNKISEKFGIKTESCIATGQIHSEILRYSEEKKIDLIVMGTHGVSGFNEVFMGSSAQRVVTLSEIPILTMQNKNNKSEFKNILIPIDNSSHSREKVNIAIILAKLFGAFIHIIGLPDSEEKSEINKFKIKLESVEKFFSAANLSYLSSIVNGKNLAAEAIKYASKNKCDLIIINTGHESRIDDVFLGAFAQQIVNHSRIPVLSYKHSEGSYIIDVPGFGIS